MSVPFRDLLDLKLLSDTIYNRVEGSPRLEDADRGLRAEMRDPLWTLARQWVLGEFQGDDSASPLTAELSFQELPIGYPSGSAPGASLLEAELESEPFIPDVRARVQAGLSLRRMMSAHGLSDEYEELLAAFPILGAEARGLVEDDASTAFIESCARTVADGWAIVVDHMVSGTTLDEADIELARVEPHINRLRAEIEATYGPLQRGDGFWMRESLDYEAPLAVGDEEDVLLVDEYRGGRLDWWNFELRDEVAWTAADVPTTQTYLPTAIEFPGMPLSRYWEIEDWRVDFGRVTAAATDLARLLLVEFALVYSEDWFLVPLDARRGSLIRVTDLEVTNTFGEVFRIPQAGEKTSLHWDRWSTGHPSVTSRYRGSRPVPLQADSNQSLLFAPASMSATDGPAIEEVVISRDEMANKVWGIEVAVANLVGEASSMADYWRDADPPTLPPPEGDGLHYTFMTDVPFNWIPFLAVSEVEWLGFARSRALLRVPFVRTTTEGNQRILPKGALIGTEDADPYLLHEEGVNRVAQRIVRRFERARRPDGSVALWIARSRQAAQPQAESGLRFDGLTNIGQGDPEPQ